MATARKPPWRRPRPQGANSTVHLTAEQIAAARRRAKEAGRRYPNLVDNMWAARAASDAKTSRARKTAKGDGGTSAKKKAGARKTPRRKTPSKKTTARRPAASGSDRGRSTLPK